LLRQKAAQVSWAAFLVLEPGQALIRHLISENSNTAHTDCFSVKSEPRYPSVQIIMAAGIQDVRRIVSGLPGVVEGICHGTPAFYLRGRLLLRLRDDLDLLVVKMPIQQRDEAIESEPDIFSVTDHYRNYPAVLVTLANVRVTRLQQIIEQAWRRLASRRQLALKTEARASSPATMQEDRSE
jgi:hypothetical protein